MTGEAVFRVLDLRKVRALAPEGSPVHRVTDRQIDLLVAGKFEQLPKGDPGILGLLDEYERRIREQPAMTDCPLCHGVGWVLDCNDLDKPGPRMLELIACPISDCEASGQPLQSVQMKGPEFDRAAQHPRTGRIMAVHR